jgi:hypothetical protein
MYLYAVDNFVWIIHLTETKAEVIDYEYKEFKKLLIFLILVICFKYCICTLILMYYYVGKQMYIFVFFRDGFIYKTEYSVLVVDNTLQVKCIRIVMINVMHKLFLRNLKKKKFVHQNFHPKFNEHIEINILD